MNSLFSKALEYAVHGYSVIPLKADKRPIIASWKKYQTQRASEEQIEEWYKKYPNALVGIVTGKISGITVIDIDVYKEGTTNASAFPPTLTIKTGNGGYHLYYSYQPGLTISANAYSQFPGVDIRSDGGYIVAPPSVTDYEGKGGPYVIYKNLPIAPFPAHLFNIKKKKRPLSTLIGTPKGSRNDSITSFIGQLLRTANEKEWETEVYPAVERANKTYTPPLPSQELRTTFLSIAKKEKERREALIVSPIQFNDEDDDGNPTTIKIPIRRNASGSPYKDMANVLAVLQHHPYFIGNIRYNEFRREIEYKGKPLDDNDIGKIQYFMQKDAGLPSVTKETVYSAILHYANENTYDEAKNWLVAQIWDGVPRLSSWIHHATGLPNDPYHQGVGSQWFMGIIKRIVEPGCIFDYVLVLVGPQGIGKTSLFRILGGPWYKNYVGAIDNKDFYLALRGAVLIDLDEGAALYKSEAIKIKSIITDTHDEYRAPYDRMVKKYARRFVFSMSTNDTEPFRDVTGNRRYWTVDAVGQINFKWLEENRDQLYAEAYHYYKEKLEIPEIPMNIALENQERHLSEDSWGELVLNELQKSTAYCKGDINYSTTIMEIFMSIFSDVSKSDLTRSQEMRIASIMKKEGGLEKRQIMIDGERKMRWMLSDKKAKELQAKNAKDTRDKFDL